MLILIFIFFKFISKFIKKNIEILNLILNILDWGLYDYKNFIY